MAREVNTLNLANALVMRAEARDLRRDVASYEKALAEKNETLAHILLDKITKEQQRLSPCDKFDEEEVAVAILIKKRRQNGRT